MVVYVLTHLLGGGGEGDSWIFGVCEAASQPSLLIYLSSSSPVRDPLSKNKQQQKQKLGCARSRGTSEVDLTTKGIMHVHICEPTETHTQEDLCCAVNVLFFKCVFQT